MSQRFLNSVATSFLLLVFFTVSAFAQGSANIQPSIIVIPFAKEGDTLRTVLENDIALRVAIAKVKEGFDNRGFTTIDFVATLKNLETDRTFTSDDLVDLKSMLIESSRADIYVEVTAEEQDGGSNGSTAIIIMTAFDAFTARSLATKTAMSVESRASYVKLVDNALNRKAEEDGQVQVSLIEDFLNTLQSKFDDVVENGRAIKVLFTLDPNVDFDFNSECASGDLVSEELEFWMEENAFKGNFTDSRPSGLRVVFDEVRIPLKRENGRNYRPSRFASDIRKFIKTLDIPDNGGPANVESNVRGGTIYISLKS
ncbi:MAG: DUF6175 family protein [Saprospiraceae bacterium]